MADTSNNPYSFDNFIKVVNENFTVFLMVGLTFIAGFGVGSLYEKSGGTRMADSGSAPTAAAPTDDAAPAAPSGPTEDQLSQINEVTDDDWIRGAEDAPITIVEYSDYSCPFCQRFHDTMKQVLADNEGTVRWVYRHYPLDNIHPDARPIAAVAECVGREAGNEAFWTFTDLAFEQQDTITAANAAQLAADELGLDAATLESCAAEDAVQQAVEDDFQDGQTVGVTGTPGNVIISDDGQYDFLPGAVPASQVQTAIDNLQ